MMKIYFLEEREIKTKIKLWYFILMALYKSSQLITNNFIPLCRNMYWIDIFIRLRNVKLLMFLDSLFKKTNTICLNVKTNYLRFNGNLNILKEHKGYGFYIMFMKNWIIFLECFRFFIYNSRVSIGYVGH